MRFLRNEKRDVLVSTNVRLARAIRELQAIPLDSWGRDAVQRARANLEAQHGRLQAELERRKAEVDATIEGLVAERDDDDGLDATQSIASSRVRDIAVTGGATAYSGRCLVTRARQSRGKTWHLVKTTGETLCGITGKHWCGKGEEIEQRFVCFECDAFHEIRLQHGENLPADRARALVRDLRATAKRRAFRDRLDAAGDGGAR